MKKIPLLFILLFAVNCLAQFSKTHYIPPLTSNTSAGVTPQDHYIYISTPSIQDVKFKILQIGGITVTGTVNKTSPYRYYIGTGENTQLFESSTNTGKIANKGFIIESEGLIYVNIRTNSGGGNQAGGLVAKGISGLGKRFRAGAMLNSSGIEGLLNFFSILATENNTKITISNIPNGTVLANGNIFSGSEIINLNKNESYILAINGNTGSNLIGALIESDKNIVVNSGSFGGTNDPTNNSNAGRDVGFDQIVGKDKIGSEYIFIKGQGTDAIEKVLLIADEDNTEIYINGNTTAVTTIQAGQKYVLDGSQFANNNLHIKTSKNVFAYQSIGARNSNANQNLFFVPPLNCSTPKIVDNIPLINLIGNTNYSGVVNIVTETGSLVTINNGSALTNPLIINGNPQFVYYSITGLTGDVAIKSSKQVYVSYYGTNINATYGGYYSGFDIKPELSIDTSTSVSGNCIPNITIKTEPDVDYTYQWLNNGVDINGETGNTYTPITPGYYQVKRSIPSCNTSNLSDKIPVSNCSFDLDNDAVPDNIDLDFDNDGITNCEESFGDLELDLTGTSIVKNTYSNSFSSSITKNPTTSSATVVAKNNGDFMSEIPIGIGNYLEYKFNFTTPISLKMEYIDAANLTDLLNSDGEFIVKSDSDKTITVLNPTNQLVIDTNYDGVYESGVTEYSSFEIRFRLNSTTPLAAGTGTFSFQSHLTSSLTFIHKNLSETKNNLASFSIKAKCIPRDTDSDATPDFLDMDSDNDGISDLIESQPNTAIALSPIDSNKDGLYDVFGTGTIPHDTDSDTILDYLDLDSDNDGIKDNVETEADQDADGIRNYRDMDRENDGCNDVVEAGFSDGDSDGKYGIAPISVNQNGLVISAAYTVPNADYSISAPIFIDNLDAITKVCDKENAQIIITGNSGIIFQWQKSRDGINWSNITDDSIYLGTSTSTLKINNVNRTMTGDLFRVSMSKFGNSCGQISNSTQIVVNELPTINPNIDLVQCIENSSIPFTSFNLTEKNNFISNSYDKENFTYYTSLNGAETNNLSELIINPIAYTSDPKNVWSRIENRNGCVNFSSINLIVSSTKIPTNFEKIYEICDDDNQDKDGITTFNFKSIEDEIKQFLIPPFTNYTIKCYENELNALREQNEITDFTNFQNSKSPNLQYLWLRVDNKIDNSCFALGRHIKLIVNPKPNINTNEDGLDNKIVCNNLPAYFVTLSAGISNLNYNWSKDGNSLPFENNSILNVNKEGIYTVKVTTDKGCSRIRTIKVYASDIATINSIDIDDLKENNSIKINITGIGNYEYSIDSSPFEASNLFEYVTAGIHDLYIKDKNGCGTITKPIAVIGISKFFTPNGDGFNDYWNVKGVNSNFNSKSLIYIFDRYGKLLKQILPSSQGWDGTINGKPMPADDYWFSFQLNNREAKGHFSLKR